MSHRDQDHASRHWLYLAIGTLLGAAIVPHDRCVGGKAPGPLCSLIQLPERLHPYQQSGRCRIWWTPATPA